MNTDQTDLMELYLTNPEIKQYVNKYMNCRELLSVNDALKHKMVKEYIKYILAR